MTDRYLSRLGEATLGFAFGKQDEVCISLVRRSIKRWIEEFDIRPLEQALGISRGAAMRRLMRDKAICAAADEIVLAPPKPRRGRKQSQCDRLVAALRLEIADFKNKWPAWEKNGIPACARAIDLHLAEAARWDRLPTGRHVIKEIICQMSEFAHGDGHLSGQ